MPRHVVLKTRTNPIQIQRLATEVRTLEEVCTLESVRILSHDRSDGKAMPGKDLQELWIHADWRAPFTRGRATVHAAAGEW